MRTVKFLVCIFFISLFYGCETAHQVTKETGKVIGEGANVVGGISEGGAEAVQGQVTNEENPYGR